MKPQSLNVVVARKAVPQFSVHLKHMFRSTNMKSQKSNPCGLNPVVF